MTEDELILTHILQCSRSELYLRNLKLTDQQKRQFESYKARRKQGEPLQYILGVWDFMGIELKVDPRALIPRPETEILVEEAIRRIKHLKNPKILELGTGLGNIAIALAKFVAGSFITTVDISSEALELAKENALRHDVMQRIDFVRMDMAEYLTTGGTAIYYDLIISNPPYIPLAQMKDLPLDVQQEPRLALEAGRDGLKFYIDIIKYTPPLLRKGCYLMMEFSDGQGLAVKDLVLKQQVFSNIQILQDLAGKDRIICAQIF